MQPEWQCKETGVVSSYLWMKRDPEIQTKRIRKQCTAGRRNNNSCCGVRRSARALRGLTHPRNIVGQTPTKHEFWREIVRHVRFDLPKPRHWRCKSRATR